MGGRKKGKEEVGRDQEREGEGSGEGREREGGEKRRGERRGVREGEGGKRRGDQDRTEGGKWRKRERRGGGGEHNILTWRNKPLTELVVPAERDTLVGETACLHTRSLKSTKSNEHTASTCANQIDNSNNNLATIITTTNKHTLRFRPSAKCIFLNPVFTTPADSLNSS